MDFAMMSPRVAPAKTPKQRVQRKFMEDLTPKESPSASATSSVSSSSSVESTPEVTPSPSEPSSLLKDDSDSEVDDSGSSTSASPAAKRLNVTAPGAMGRATMPKIMISSLSEQHVSPPTDDALDPSSEECSESTYADLEVDLEDELEPAIVLTDENREKLRAKRTNIAKEILSTEAAYVANLETLVEVFMEPMREAADQGVITKEDVKNVFGNIRIILTYNQELLTNVRERVENWGDEVLLGDIFVRMAVFFKTYTTYVNDYRIALATLKRLGEENTNFDVLMKRIEENPRTTGKTIKFFLIMPVQRIPRYTMLLKDLKDKTWEGHPDFANLSQAYKKFLEITQFVEDSQEKSHQISKLVGIQSELVGRKAEKLTLVQPGRVLVKEGAVQEEVKPESLRKRFVYLFNDLIIITKQKKVGKEIRHMSPLYQVSGIKPLGGKAISVTINQVPVLLHTASDEEQTAWFDTLVDSLVRAMQVYQTFRKKDGSLDNEPAMSPRKRHATMPGRPSHGYMKVGGKSSRSKAGTLPAGGLPVTPPEEELVETVFRNPLMQMRHAGSSLSASSPAKRSTITNGDAVQAELLAASKSARKSKGSRIAALSAEEGVRKSPSMNFIEPDAPSELSPRKQRSLTFQCEDGSTIEPPVRSSSTTRIKREGRDGMTSGAGSFIASPATTSTSSSSGVITSPGTSPKKQSLKRSLSVENIKNSLLKKSGSSSSTHQDA